MNELKKLRVNPALIDFKRWKMDEAERCGLTENAINRRVIRGKYPGLKLIREGRNSIFIECAARIADEDVPRRQHNS